MQCGQIRYIGNWQSIVLSKMKDFGDLYNKYYVGHGRQDRKRQIISRKLSYGQFKTGRWTSKKYDKIFFLVDQNVRSCKSGAYMMMLFVQDHEFSEHIYCFQERVKSFKFETIKEGEKL